MRRWDCNWKTFTNFWYRRQNVVLKDDGTVSLLIAKATDHYSKVEIQQNMPEWPQGDDLGREVKWSGSAIATTDFLNYGSFEVTFRLPALRHNWPVIWISTTHEIPAIVISLNGFCLSSRRKWWVGPRIGKWVMSTYFSYFDRKINNYKTYKSDHFSGELNPQEYHSFRAELYPGSCSLYFDGSEVLRGFYDLLEDDEEVFWRIGIGNRLFLDRKLPKRSFDSELEIYSFVYSPMEEEEEELE